MFSDGRPVLEVAVAEGRPRVGGPYRVKGVGAEVAAAFRGIRHTLTLPLVLAGSTTGILLVSRRRDRPFDGEDALTLQLVGSLAALMMRNARLFAEAKEASRLRSEFLNMAAHELRTPLTVISGYLSMLNDGSLGEAPVRWQGPIELLTAKAGELGRLIDDLLLTSRLESGGLPGRADELDLRGLAEAAARRAAPRVDLVRGRLTVDLPARPVTVVGDPEQLARVLDNLVNNALTYHRPNQSPSVRLEVLVEDGAALVAVEDRGRGVATAMRERIFERFVRGEESGDRNAGTGLGLYISRQIAHRHGGSVELQWSIPGEASRFLLRLPMASS